MKKRIVAVAIIASALAMPAAAAAGHGKGKGHDKSAKVERKAAKSKKPASFVFKGVYKGAGVVTVSKGNSRVRKGGFVGTDVTFDLSAAKIVAADSDGVAGVTAADLQVGDLVVVKARMPRGTKAAAPAAEGAEPVAPVAIKARQVVDQTHPPVEQAEEAEQEQQT